MFGNYKYIMLFDVGLGWVGLGWVIENGPTAMSGLHSMRPFLLTTAQEDSTVCFLASSCAKHLPNVSLIF